MKNTLLYALLLLLTINVSAQSNWNYNPYINAGFNLNLYAHGKQRFPGVKGFIGFACSAVNDNLIANYSVSLSIYTKTIGTNLNPLKNDLQVDLTNSFSLGAGFNGKTNYERYMRTINNCPFYNMNLQHGNAFLLSTNFIINNHHRNQSIGTLTYSSPEFSVYYANDGAPPFSWLGLSDNLDRYWTGSGCLFIHNKDGYNTMEIGFDQFTGYSSLLYELSDILGINVPYYQIKENKNNYNSSEYRIRYYFDKNYAVDLGVIGDLKSKNGRMWGVQEMIHYCIQSALHPNYDINRLIIGTNFNTTSYVK